VGALASLLFNDVRHSSSEEYNPGGMLIGLQTRGAFGLQESNNITAAVAGSISESSMFGRGSNADRRPFVARACFHTVPGSLWQQLARVYIQPSQAYLLSMNKWGCSSLLPN